MTIKQLTKKIPDSANTNTKAIIYFTYKLMKDSDSFKSVFDTLVEEPTEINDKALSLLSEILDNFPIAKFGIPEGIEYTNPTKLIVLGLLNEDNSEKAVNRILKTIEITDDNSLKLVSNFYTPDYLNLPEDLLPVVDLAPIFEAPLFRQIFTSVDTDNKTIINSKSELTTMLHSIYRRNIILNGRYFPISIPYFKLGAN